MADRHTVESAAAFLHEKCAHDLEIQGEKWMLLKWFGDEIEPVDIPPETILRAARVLCWSPEDGVRE